jgi:hypothetical protein
MWRALLMRLLPCWTTSGSSKASGLSRAARGLLERLLELLLLLLQQWQQQP